MVKLILITVLLFTSIATFAKSSPKWDVGVSLSLDDSCYIEGDSMSVTVEIINREANATFYVMTVQMNFTYIKMPITVLGIYIPPRFLFIHPTVDESSIAITPGEQYVSHYRVAIDDLKRFKNLDALVSVLMSVDSGKKKRKKEMTIAASQHVEFKVFQINEYSNLDESR